MVEFGLFFFISKKIRTGLRNIQKPVMDHLLMVHATQSISLYVVSEKSEDTGRKMPFEEQPRKYLRR